MTTWAQGALVQHMQRSFEREDVNNDGIFNLLVSCTREILPELEAHIFQRTDSLRDLGANSLDRSEIIMMTLEAMDLPIPATEFRGLEHIGELADMIYGKLDTR